MNDSNDTDPSPRPSGPAPHAAQPFQHFRGWLRRLLRGRNGADDLRDAIEELIEPENGAAGSTDELVLIRNILNLRGKTVYDVMVPRVDIVAIEDVTSLGDVVQIMGRTAHSRIPVYHDTLDDVIGMVHIKDVLAITDGGKDFKLAKTVRPVLFVAPSMPILELLLQMRANRIHMALVVDEFGGIDGLVTIEDLVEEIVGEIADEHELDVEPVLTPRPDGSVLADARVEIEDFEEAVGPILTDAEREEDIDTLGGLVFFLAGRVPGRGEIIRHSGGVEFEVLEADPRRIRRLRVCNLPTPPALSA